MMLTAFESAIPDRFAEAEAHAAPAVSRELPVSAPFHSTPGTFPAAML